MDRRFLPCLLFTFVTATALAAEQPGFDCRKATSTVTKLICATPALASLDAQLNDLFNATLAQPTVDATKLKQDEADWLRQTRNACADVACLSKAYENRIAAIRAPSQHAASPAAADETQPFPAPPALLAEAKGWVGKACMQGRGALPLSSGFVEHRAYLPVIARDTVVQPLFKQGVGFAFLLDTQGKQCRVADVVALPASAVFLQCTVPADDDRGPAQSAGVGLRRMGQKSLLAYWEVSRTPLALVRQPLSVLGWAGKVRCQEPETGE